MARRHQAGAVDGAGHPRQDRRGGVARDLHRRPARHHPLRLGERPQRRPQPAGSAARAGCVADRRALPMQLAGRRGAVEGGLTGDRRRRTANMTIDTIRDALPDYAKDLKLNLSALLNAGTLSEQQRWGTLLATALAARNAKLVAAVADEAARHLTPEAIAAAKAAAS